MHGELTPYDLMCLANCSESDLELLADHDIQGAESEISRRLQAQRLLILKVEKELAKQNKAAGLFQ